MNNKRHSFNYNKYKRLNLFIMNNKTACHLIIKNIKDKIYLL